MKKRFLLLALVPLLLGACATGSTTAPVVPGGPPAALPVLNLALAKDTGKLACFSLVRDGNSASVLAKVDAAQALLNGGNVLQAITDALVARETDPRRRILLSVIIDLTTASNLLPSTSSPIPAGSPAALYIGAGLAGCREGVALGSPAVQSVRAERLEVPAPASPALSDYLYKVSFTTSIAKSNFFFDTSRPLNERFVHGRVDLSKPAGTYERMGLDAKEVKGPTVGEEGVNCTIVQYWIDTAGPSIGIPPSYQCTPNDLVDAMFLSGRSGGNINDTGNNWWNDVALATWSHRPGQEEPPPPPPPPTGPPVCLSGRCLPECPENCVAPPPPPPPPPPVGCPPTHPALVLPARIADTLKQIAAGHMVVNPRRYREVATFFAQHPGLLVP